MKNNNGSAVAIVMLVLGIVSLIGVALLTQSRMDMQLTTSLKTYDELVSLADARATDELNKLKRSYHYNNPEWPEPSVAPAYPVGFNHPSNVVGRTAFLGYSVTPGAGWQKGSPGMPAGFQEEHYVVQGAAWKQFGYASYGTAAPSVPETVVSIAVTVIKRDAP